MSNFKVPVTIIREIKPHSNAEKLEIATIYGFQVIIPKGVYSAGSVIIYAPVDSILPHKVEELLFPADSKIKLTKGRIRQIRIRNYASQGMVIDPPKVMHLIAEYAKSKGLKEIVIEPEQDLAEILGITKYEPGFAGLPQQGSIKRNKPKENPLFHKYGGCENIKWQPDFFEGTEVTVQEKLHGCLRNWEDIELVDGTKKTIQEIVDNKLQVEVWGLDEKTNKIVPTKVTNWFNNGTTKDWLKVKFTKNNAGGGNHFRTVEATPNHRFYCPEIKEYIRAENIKPGMKLLFKRDDYDINYIQEQILIGKMLGDASVNGDRKLITFGHSEKQELYLYYTLNSLGDLSAGRGKNQTSGYGSKMVRGTTRYSNSIQDLFNDWYISGVKQVPKSVINMINPIALAFWYMDDGSLSHHEDQEDRANFAVCSFSEESVDNLILSLNKFGINAVKYQTKNKTDVLHWRIRLNANEAEKFFFLVTPYIVESMRYKVPERYRDIPFIELPKYEGKYKSKLVEQTVISVEPVSVDGKNLNKYDIETETHNFFVNGILVHNSNARYSLLPNKPNTLWKKVLNFLGLMPKLEFCYGSNNVQLQSKGYTNGFYDENVYAKMIKQEQINEKLQPGETIYGEIVGPGIQANYHYDIPQGKHRFVLFDVKFYDGQKSRFLDPDEVRKFAIERGFEMVPELYRGSYNLEHIRELTKGNSVYAPGQKVREGVVLKSLIGYDDEYHGKKARKLISEDYLNDKTNTDEH